MYPVCRAMSEGGEMDGCLLDGSLLARWLVLARWAFQRAGAANSNRLAGLAGLGPGRVTRLVTAHTSTHQLVRRKTHHSDIPAQKAQIAQIALNSSTAQRPRHSRTSTAQAAATSDSHTPAPTMADITTTAQAAAPAAETPAGPGPTAEPQASATAAIDDAQKVSRSLVR